MQIKVQALANEFQCNATSTKTTAAVLIPGTLIDSVLEFEGKEEYAGSGTEDNHNQIM